MMIRWARLCLNSITTLGQAVTHTVYRLQQWLGERFIDHLAQLVDVTAQAVTVGAIIPP